ncbi:C40 family peptidase [Labedaea rhizosphaerae]|uniref:Cell wall-associated NlpC family hydrolase n=1 Tax=Labedaea rhizosphaerae TaxID=598644 RepID=A0A4R6SCG5_LABRH|nr:C40 family peptidase [Labedaea rhizosphaerae]TDP96736.1 cell wall-associated NlpC family hydrolase [Labedaea rhizosphaerae]
MASQRLKRSIRRVLTAGAVTAVVSLSPMPALADPTTSPPPPKTASEALKQYQELTKQTEIVNEDLQQAKEDLKQRQTDLTKANGDLAKAKTMLQDAGRRENEFRGQVDQLAGASFEGARFNQLSALFTGTNAQDFLDRASALNVLASGNAKVLEGLQGAVNEAEQGRNLTADAQRRAATAKTTAQNLVNQITQKKKALITQVNKIRDAYSRLSGTDRDTLNGGNFDPSYFIPPPGAAGVAMQTALAQIGDPYVWGATGPDSFDCSGLMLYSYGKAGITLPRTSRSQYSVGTPVSRDQLQPGDLLFFGSSPATIHHVAMYIGDGKMVHASTTGVPVKIAVFERSDFVGAKRVA